MNVSSRSRRPSGFGRIGQRRHRPDYWLLILSVIMLVLGLIVVYAISPALSAQKDVGENYYVNKQLIAIAMGIVGFIFVANTPTEWWRKAEKPLLVAAVFAAAIVRLAGEEVNGAHRWIHVAGLSFQAAELIKLALLVWLAGFLSDRIRNGELNDYQKSYKPMIIATGIVTFVVAIIQKDLGSAAVLVSMIMAMTFVAGLPLKKVVLAFGLIAITGVLLILPFSYRRDRLNTFLNPTRDCQGSGYQSCQALISVGSGGLFGKGLGRGAQAFGYQPEPANDSIFAIFAEKFGFIGAGALLGLFVALFSRIKRVMERAPDNYSRLLVAGILAWLSTQAIINIGAMVGLLPLKGITLPFISYGGTSVLFVSLAIGIVFQISRYTTYGATKENEKTTDKNYGSTQTVAYRARSG